MERVEHWESEYKTWKELRNRESSSGVGSTLHNTELTRKTIREVIDKYEVKTILDCPCGDLNWITHVDLSNQEYTGMDISEEIIKDSTARNLPGKEFKVHDIVTAPLDKEYDLIICRDLLFHLNVEDTHQVLKHFKDSGSKLALISHFPGSGSPPSWVRTNGFYRIDLSAPPFSLNIIEDYNEVESGKHLALVNI